MICLRSERGSRCALRILKGVFSLEYLELEKHADKIGVNIEYRNFRNERIRGLYCDGHIAINSNIDTTAERKYILAEEIGHYHTSSGNILDQSTVSNRKQEHLARMWAYDKLINLIGIIDCYKAGCRNRYEAAEYLNVPEECFQDTIDAYRRKYGQFVQVADYVIYFEPCLAVVEMM